MIEAGPRTGSPGASPGSRRRRSPRAHIAWHTERLALGAHCPVVYPLHIPGRPRIVTRPPEGA